MEKYIRQGLFLNYHPQLFTPEHSEEYYHKLLRDIDWEQEELKIFGKNHLVPRLVAWYGGEDATYKYSSKIHIPKPWTPLLLKIKSKIESITDLPFNSVLLNYYRNGKDKMGWHADNERELGEDPVIASVSFGATRRIDFKKKEPSDERIKINLESGSLLIMKGKTQTYWKHQIPQQKKVLEGRINLTFRFIKSQK